MLGTIWICLTNPICQIGYRGPPRSIGTKDTIAWSQLFLFFAVQLQSPGLQSCRLANQLHQRRVVVVKVAVALLVLGVFAIKRFVTDGLVDDQRKGERTVVGRQIVQMRRVRRKSRRHQVVHTTRIVDETGRQVVCIDKQSYTRRHHMILTIECILQYVVAQSDAHLSRNHRSVHASRVEAVFGNNHREHVFGTRALVQLQGLLTRVLQRRRLRTDNIGIDQSSFTKFAFLVLRPNEEAQKHAGGD